MRAVLTRVKMPPVEGGGKTIGQIGQGLSDPAGHHP